MVNYWEILRLTGLGYSQWQIAASVHSFRSTISEVQGLARKLDLTLLLDETITEADIYCRFSKLTGDKTTIFVSHRLGICKIVDRILVFDDDEIIEDGSHEELLKKNGLYTKMYKGQAELYK